MKKILFAIVIVAASVVQPHALQAQNFDNPGTYMTAISNAQTEMNKKYMAYISASAHSGQAKKIEKMRQLTLESITNSKFKIIDLPYYKGDNSLRKSSIDYVDLCYKVFNEDYAHIVNMEEIAEQSFDEMEAYLLLREKTNEKIREAYANMDTAVKNFANKYNVKIIETKNELDEKMETASKINHYHNKVYLVFFKCNWQDAQLIKALEKKNLNNIEQSRNALISYANEGLAAIDTLEEFQGDHSLANVCRQALKIYKSIAENDISKLTDFFLKEENFDKIKKSFELTDASSRTKEVVNAYNKAVNEINSAVNLSNSTSEKSNKSRNQAVQNWNDTEKSFLDAHMPYYN